MAGFISHVVYAQKFLKARKTNDPQYHFIVGSLLPDIRYLGVVNKELTHFSTKSLNNAHRKIDKLLSTQKNAKSQEVQLFKDGFLFHSYLDNWWKKQIFVPSSSKFIGLVLKLFEDQIHYSKLSFWNEINKRLLTQPDPVKINNIDKTQKVKWYTVLSSYFSSPPNAQTQLQFLKKMHFVPETAIKEIERTFSDLPKWAKKRFNQMLENYPNKLVLKWSK